MAGPGDVPPVLSEQARAALWEGVRLCLERWSALQLAVDHGFGSASQVQQLHSDVFKWLTASKGSVYTLQMFVMLVFRINFVQRVVADKFKTLGSWGSEPGFMKGFKVVTVRWTLWYCRTAVH